MKNENKQITQRSVLSGGTLADVCCWIDLQGKVGRRMHHPACVGAQLCSSRGVITYGRNLVAHTLQKAERSSVRVSLAFGCVQKDYLVFLLAVPYPLWLSALGTFNVLACLAFPSLLNSSWFSYAQPPLPEAAFSIALLRNAICTRTMNLFFQPHPTFSCLAQK